MSNREWRSASSHSSPAAVDLMASLGLGGYFFDDQAAIRAGARKDGFSYVGPARTPGYTRVREPSEIVSVMLRLPDGYVAIGDCASVQYAGVAGRERRLDATALAAALEAAREELLGSIDLSSFRASCRGLSRVVQGTPDLGTAALYGLSQAVLDAVAHSKRQLRSRVITDEWGLGDAPLAAVPVYAQTGEERRLNVDKMILKGVDVLPHGLINDPSLVGPDASVLVEYVRWITERIAQLRVDPTYAPPIHIDVYGLLGVATGGDVGRVASMIGKLETAAGDHQLRIEHPLDAGGLDAQIAAMTQLRTLLREQGSSVRLIADEWANTLTDITAFAAAGAADLIQVKTPDLGSLADAVDAVLTCHEHGVGALVGGTCAETDVSARACVHVALATRADQLLAKPGMGVDEGLAIVTNEMRRTIRLDADPIERNRRQRECR